MKPVVLDSSVLVATAFVETYSSQAIALISRLVAERYEFHAPALVYYEVVNVIRKAVYFGRIVEEEGLRYRERLLTTPITVHVDLDLVNRAYELARLLKLPRAYDAQYLAVAEYLRCELWTADERLFNSVRTGFPLIRWLGQIEGQSYGAPHSPGPL